MKKIVLACLVLLLTTTIAVYAQTNNPVSIYEGMQIQSVGFAYDNIPADTTLANAYRKIVETEFGILPQSQFNSFMTSYHVSQLSLLSFVKSARLDVKLSDQNMVVVSVHVTLSADGEKSKSTGGVQSLPVLFNSERAYLTLKAAASEMVYSNNNTWFGQPTAMTTGNPLAEKPTGAGYSAWLEGFASAGIYGIAKLVPKLNLHLYGGVNYLVSFSAGNELFTDKARFHGDVEEAFAGVIGGGRDGRGRAYKYNVTYGRKQFTLGDGWLIINTSMNGYNRASLQLNPRWAGKELLLGSVSWDKILLQGFHLRPNELDILNSKTVINGLNLQLSNNKNGIVAFSFLQVPRSNFRYYLPDGTVHTRDGLQVYNLRVFKNTGQKGGLFFKAEGGYQRNANFDMSAWAYYGELGWNFARTQGSPAVSYRYAYFSGDDPDTKSYNRWDALYTGGNSEQWVQGSNMYKIVQNSNEISHRLQAVYSPLRKIQLVGQAWLFYAPQKNNIGGNPALSTLKSDFYGTEFNLTVKYFHSRNWYFHLNTAYTLPGGAIKDIVPDTKDWFCLSFFARYSF